MIPANQTTAYMTVTPILDSSVTENVAITVTLESGNYEVPSANTRTLSLVNIVPPSGYNTWVAAKDGLASVDANWSSGVAPTAADNVLFDGRFSNANCEWDIPAVNSWMQTVEYTSAVEIQTTYANGAFLRHGRLHG